MKAIEALSIHNLCVFKNFMDLVSRNGPSRRGFNLDQVNLAHSQITSIEHITMNPGPELYMEYYSEYDFPTDNYDHIGDIGQLVSRRSKQADTWLSCF